MRGLLVDFGGVLTTNVFQSFKQFSEREGLDPDHVKEKFRSVKAYAPEASRKRSAEVYVIGKGYKITPAFT